MNRCFHGLVYFPLSTLQLSAASAGPPEDIARMNEVGEVGQLHTHQKAYEKRDLVNLVNLFDAVGGPRRLDRTLRVHWICSV